MKREVKFRALKDDMSNCTFVYGQLIYLKEELSGNSYPSITEDGILFISCLPNTESQFTGLTDKNGKEIYEGDVVNVEYYNHEMPNTKKKQFISFLDGCFAIVSSVDNTNLESDRNCSPIFWAYRPNTIEVIGNIYEHENLLNG
jgi:uncharacterized phage protein (TIGR01671 family)